MNFPTLAGQDILRELITHIASGRVVPNQPDTYLGYKEIHDALHLIKKAETFGDSLKVQGLSDLAEWTLKEKHPAVTGLIVTKMRESDEYLQPGQGYFKLFGKKQDYAWWTAEVQRSLSYPWQNFIEPARTVAQTPLSPSPKTEVACDISEPPERVLTEIYRILRDTERARRVKEKHNYNCQICGHTIELPNGKRYAEAHHIQPLGSPHNGTDDDDGNILCVCPNHHAELDYGVIGLTLEMLSKHETHRANPKYIEYHNQVIYRPVKS